MNNTGLRVYLGHMFYWGQEIPKPQHTYNELKIIYNQNEIHKYSCSLHACMTAISNNYNIYFNLEDRKSIYNLAIARGFNPAWGWYMDKAVECVRDWVEDHKGISLEPLIVNWTKYRAVTNMGYGIVCGYRQREGFKEDRKDNIIGNEDIRFGDVQLGHLVTLFGKRAKNMLARLFQKLIFVDNYKNVINDNEVRISHLGLAGLIEKDVLFQNGYIFVKR